MKETIVTMSVGLAMAAFVSVSAANATMYSFAFESSDADLSVVGELTVDSSDEVVAVTGAISGIVDQTINGITANPNFPNAAYSPDGSFIYNNLFYSSNTRFDIDGLLFTTAQNPGGYWNLFGNFPGNYSLYESVGSGNYPIAKVGQLSVVAAPELSTWAMMGLGFASLGFAGRRRALRLSDAGLA